ncbi:hypothetical protein TWF225_002149 [Orbilia oligospora]|uniref:Feruloyl esterase C n=1 Tax=Orbilia oligospora TaxID=2813651 RepID=A0A7C8KA56_ORBOL|nr:hypothetical protein TWF751_009067 [Orbilia oligospora]KAF3190386.1 hypothetical protein TWF225_002149 [Orbilia oligospora]KAF3242738.1 hypothetical protein TWF217_011447 [Orbilia oligospora]KAF3258000.1 hypothetical protein TWF128_004899 [Orbilia oligospora]KAF3280063.1 hypothetical protein TWF132_011911 [Orbilia oligospora]
MKSVLVSLSALAGLAQVVVGQQSVWGQCGGIGYTGATVCASGSCCTYQNAYYSQCLPGSCNPGGTQTTTMVTTTSRAATSSTTSANNPGSTALSPGCGKGATLTSGTKSMTVNGKTRQYILRVPNNYDQNKPYRLIFGLHWLSGTMTDVATGQTVQRDVWSYYGLQQLASESAIFVAPQGLNNGWANSGGEDITFIDQIMSTVEAGLCVNQKLRFATGFSYGGAMSFSLACSRASAFRAVAVLSGGQLSGCNGGNDPIAYLGIHGISDSVLNISGGRTLRDRFVRNNGCNSMSPREPSQGSLTHVKTEYTGCRSGYPVTWIAFDGGHIAAPRDGSGGDSGATFASRETWSFFSQFT